MKKDKGLVHIYTGEGKCKTTAALGLSVRAAGSGMKVLFVQFFKEESAPSGEKSFLRGLAEPGIELVRSSCKHPLFTGKKTDPEKVKRAVRETFEAARDRAVRDTSLGLLVLDEVMAAVNGGWVDISEVEGLLDERPEGLEVVLTGRDAPVELVKRADYVIEMLKIKHPFDAGVKARKGIEY